MDHHLSEELIMPNKKKKTKTPAERWWADHVVLEGFPPRTAEALKKSLIKTLEHRGNPKKTKAPTHD